MKYRWWLPRGNTDAAQLEREIELMKEAGAGGAEISPFPNPGGGNTTGLGLVESGWMSHAWLDRLPAIYEAGQKNEFIVDNTLSGLGADAASVPVDGGLNSPITSKTFVTGSAVLAEGEPFTGAIPTTGGTTFTTQLCSSASAGADVIHPLLTRAVGPGDQITIGQGADAESAVVAAVGDGTWGCGQLSLPVAAGDTKLYLASARFNAGDSIIVGGTDAVEVRELGSPPGEYPLPLAAAASAGATSVTLVHNVGYPVGGLIGIGSGANIEYRNITSIDGFTLGLDRPLERAHAGFTSTHSFGSGITVTPLSSAHAVNTAVVADKPLGDGIRLTAPLQRDHALLTSVSAAAEKQLVAVSAYRCAVACAEAPRQLILDSVVDLTADAQDGRIDSTEWRTDGTWLIFVQQMVSDTSFSPSFSPMAPDYAVDHLSRQGAQAVIDYWTANVLTPEVEHAITANPAGLSSFFEDSLEMPFTIKWTSEMLDAWQERRGYDLRPYLPLLAGLDQQARPTGADQQRFDLVGVDAERIRQDYRQTWSDLFKDEFATPLREWAESLGMGYRLQPYGGFPIDSSAVSGVVTIPEGEGLGFDNDVNTFSVIASGAHLSGRSIVSTECCAVAGNTYRAEMAGSESSPLTDIYRSYAGGVNQVVWHGFNYRDAPGAVWPGYHAWSPEGEKPSFSEAFGPRMPVWGTGDIKEINDHLGRLQYVLRQGLPRYDVGVYNIGFGRGSYLGPIAPTITDAGPLAQHGYSTEFFSPEYLRSDDATWVDDSLFSATSGYRALVLNAQATVPLDITNKLTQLVNDGLKLVIIGERPAGVPGWDPSGAADGDVRDAFAAIESSPNVRFVVDEAAAVTALADLGVSPAAEKAEATPVTAVLRETDDARFYFLFNNTAEPVSNEWSLQGAGRPYELDTWSGRIQALGQYSSSESGDGVSLPLTIAPYDVAVIALAAEDLAPHVSDQIAVTSQGRGVYDAAGALSLRSSDGGIATVQLGSGEELSVETKNSLPATRLDDWTLTLESWQRGADTQAPGYAYEIDRVDAGTYAIQSTSEGIVPSWRELDPSLELVSGIGVYTTQVTVPDDYDDTGAVLSLGEVTDTASIRVNGVSVPVNLQHPQQIDLGAALKPGVNDIEVTVASTLNNAAMRTGIQDYGLRGPVVLRGYQDTVIAAAPSITAHPESETVDRDAEVTLTASAVGAPRPNVTWQTRSPGAAWSDIESEPALRQEGTDAALVVSPEDTTEFRAVFRNSYGEAVTNVAVITVSAAGGPGEGGDGGSDGSEGQGQDSQDGWLAETGMTATFLALAVIALLALTIGAALLVRRRRAEA